MIYHDNVLHTVIISPWYVPMNPQQICWIFTPQPWPTTAKGQPPGRRWHHWEPPWRDARAGRSQPCSPSRCSYLPEGKLGCSTCLYWHQCELLILEKMEKLKPSHLKLSVTPMMVCSMLFEHSGFLDRIPQLNSLSWRSLSRPWPPSSRIKDIFRRKESWAEPKVEAIGGP